MRIKIDIYGNKKIKIMPAHLVVKDLSIDFENTLGVTKAVDAISFTLEKGETLGIVGESGSGKSVTALAILDLLTTTAKVSGVIEMSRGEEAAQLEQKPILRGKEVAMIFQEPMTALNPVLRCGDQILEVIVQHRTISKEDAIKEVKELLQQVQLTDVDRMYKAYPHELSGGQKQRIVIAIALAAKPSILLADEPTTALDVTIQKEILTLLNQLKASYQLSIIFISHDLGVIKQMADRVAVMQQGKMVELGEIQQVFANPKHAYTKGLLACRPSQNMQLEKLPTLDTIDFTAINNKEVAKRKNYLAIQPILLKVENISKWYSAKKNFFGQVKSYVKAVNNVSFDVRKGETFGLVGESGCGKSTLGRTIIGLEKATQGNIWYNQTNLLQLSAKEWTTWRKRLQIIFQDPYSSLNPTQPIGYAIQEPMTIHGLWNNERTRKEKTVHLLELVGLEAAHFLRFPHEFSGGQRQRVCIARALALEPEFLICDECVSALDVSVQAQILNLLIDLRTQFDLTYIFISHDLAVVRFISDRIMVMKDGEVVEIGVAEDIYERPQSLYTKQLVEAIPA